MLESLFNKVAGVQDCFKTYLLYALLRFYFPLSKTLKNVINFLYTMLFQKMLNVKLSSQRHIQNQVEHLQQSFFTSIKLLNSIELPLGSIFYTSHPFVKKLVTVKTLGVIVFRTSEVIVKNGTIFFEIRNYVMEQCHHVKQRFL